jgi:hypothetical protein
MPPMLRNLGDGQVGGAAHLLTLQHLTEAGGYRRLVGDDIVDADTGGEPPGAKLAAVAHGSKDHQLVYAHRDRLSREERLTRLNAQAGLGDIDNLGLVCARLGQQQTPRLSRLIDWISRMNPFRHAPVSHGRSGIAIRHIH